MADETSPKSDPPPTVPANQPAPKGDPPQPLGGAPTEQTTPAAKLTVTSDRAKLLLGLQVLLIVVVVGTALAVVQAIFAD
jgi:hypothetical protein